MGSKLTAMLHMKKSFVQFRNSQFSIPSNDSKCDILCPTHKSCAKNLRVDRYLKADVIGATYSGDLDGVREAQTKILIARYLIKQVLC